MNVDYGFLYEAQNSDLSSLKNGLKGTRRSGIQNIATIWQSPPCIAKAP